MKKFSLLLPILIIAVLVVAACQPKAPELGTEENPIKWVFVPSGEMESVSAGADAVADMIFAETGLVVETFVATATNPPARPSVALG